MCNKAPSCMVIVPCCRLNNRKQRLARLARGVSLVSAGAVVGAFGAGSPRGEPPQNSRAAHLQSGDPTFVPAAEPAATIQDCNNQDSAAAPSSAVPTLPADADSVGRPRQDNNREWNAHVEMATPSPPPLHFVKGQEVVLLNSDGRELGIGTIDELEGIWRSKRLDEQNLCLVEVTELKVEKETPIPYPSQRGGATFGQAEALLGIIMVFWNMKDMRPVIPG